MAHSKRAIVFLAWGEKYIAEVLQCIEKSILPDYDKILITDHSTQISSNKLSVIRAEFKTDGLLRISELLDFLPHEYDSFLFLDSDTRVIADIELGFSKAEQFGIAICSSPHYSLDYFWGFEKIMQAEGVSRSGQMQYNTGVIFFTINDATARIFRLWRELALKYHHVYRNDQPFFSLALELNDFNPYTLSISYNYRALGNAISGIVRIWHSRTEMPEKINTFNKPWPPRRVIDGQVVYPPGLESSPFHHKMVVWLASFPRSGNTMLRTVLRQCFGLYSASMYLNDFGGNKELEQYIGHLEHDQNGDVKFPENNIPLVKTHEYPRGDKPAIYVVRDGRAACLSMLDHYKDQISLEALITGRNRFGSWSEHLAAWHPWDRPKTLFIKYEDMVQNLPSVLRQISKFLNYPIISEHIPDRQAIASVDGRWVRKEKKTERQLPAEYIDLFNQVNGEMMQKLGYYEP